MPDTVPARVSWLTLLTCGLVLMSLGMQVMLLWPRLFSDAEPEEPEMMTFVFGDTTAPDALTADDLAQVVVPLPRPCRVTALRLWADGTTGVSTLRADPHPRRNWTLVAGQGWQVIPLQPLQHGTQLTLRVGSPVDVHQVRLSLACGASPGTPL